jgi:hypothetical protein
LQALVDGFLPPIIMLPPLDMDDDDNDDDDVLSEQLQQRGRRRLRDASATAAAAIEAAAQHRRRYWQHVLSRDVYFLQALEQAICHDMNPNDAMLFRSLLSLLSTSIGTSLVFGRMTLQPYCQLDNDKKTFYLQAMQQHQQQHGLRRRVFGSWKRFVCGMAYSYCQPAMSTSTIATIAAQS